MRDHPSLSPRFRTLAALGFLALLGVGLGLRLRARAAVPSAPAGAVPEARLAPLESLTVPCWGCPPSETWPVRFRTDLDVLAPLGTGRGNAATWFKDFAGPRGTRYAEAEAAMSRRVDGPGDLGKVLPGDNPILIEAEPWCDEATMRFYPDFFPVEGIQTQLPNLLVPLTLAKSWVARGIGATDSTKALEDFRRAIRLGRLLRQEDAFVINDLVGLACIRYGAQAIYDLAIRQGDTRLALAAAITLGEHAPQRLRTSQALTKISLAARPGGHAGGQASPVITDGKVDEIIAVARGDADRRFRGEAICRLGSISRLGAQAQRQKALTVLNEVARGGDPFLSRMASWSRDVQPGHEDLGAFGEY